MDELYFLIRHWKLIVISSGSFLFLIILFAVVGVNSSTPKLMSQLLEVPFNEKDIYTVTSNFGTRIDPFTKEKSFHSGIDLSASKGTEIVASADAEVFQVGYNEKGLGNYIYLKHNINNLIIYTVYGHLLDDSIVVTEGQKVDAKEKLGIIGSTGRSTGVHLHFMITINKLSFEKKYLVDPKYVIEKLN